MEERSKIRVGTRANLSPVRAESSAVEKGQGLREPINDKQPDHQSISASPFSTKMDDFVEFVSLSPEVTNIVTNDYEDLREQDSTAEKTRVSATTVVKDDATTLELSSESNSSSPKISSLDRLNSQENSFTESSYLSISSNSSIGFSLTDEEMHNLNDFEFRRKKRMATADTGDAEVATGISETSSPPQVPKRKRM